MWSSQQLKLLSEDLGNKKTVKLSQDDLGNDIDTVPAFKHSFCTSLDDCWILETTKLAWVCVSMCTLPLILTRAMGTL